MISDHIDQQPISTSDPMAVLIHPDDADTAFVAGVQFARALVGAEAGAFAMALSEQEALIHAAIVAAGFSEAKAWTAGVLFKAGARREWCRIAGLERPVVWGTA